METYVNISDYLNVMLLKYDKKNHPFYFLMFNILSECWIVEIQSKQLINMIVSINYAYSIGRS